LRNPIIGNIFFRLHNIKRFGTGVKGINNSYSQSEVKPRFEVYENSIKVVLPVMKKELTLSDDENLYINFFQVTGNFQAPRWLNMLDLERQKLLNY